MQTLRRIMLVCLLLFQCISPLSAQTEERDDFQILENKFKDLGIKTEIAEKLAEKVLHGEQLDCMKHEYNSVEPIEITYENGCFKETYEYPDGSRKIVSISAGETQYISGGAYISGGNWYSWKNALVYGSNGIITVSYRADLAGSAYDGHLLNVNSLIFAGTVNSFGVFSSDASASNPAAGGLYGIKNGIYVSLLVYVPIGSSPYAKFNL